MLWPSYTYVDREDSHLYTEVSMPNVTGTFRELLVKTAINMASILCY